MRRRQLPKPWSIIIAALLLLGLLKFLIEYLLRATYRSIDTLASLNATVTQKSSRRIVIDK